jgi:hypothetical protein
MPDLIPAPLAPDLDPAAPTPDPALAAAFDATLDHLRHLNRTAFLTYALEVGRYLIATWFDDDLQVYRDRRSPHHGAFETLLRDRREALADLHLAPNTLRNYMLANAVWRELPEGVRTRLDLTHLHLLATIPDSVTRARLAHQAAEHGWPTRELDRAIDAERAPPPGSPPRGRPKLPPPFKAWRRVVAAAQEAQELQKELKHLTPAQRTALRGELTAALSQLQRALAALEI